jgi:hypothetical protein
MASRGLDDVSSCEVQPGRANERRRVLEQCDALDEFKSHAPPRPNGPMDSLTVSDSTKCLARLLWAWTGQLKVAKSVKEGTAGAGGRIQSIKSVNSNVDIN